MPPSAGKKGLRGELGRLGVMLLLKSLSNDDDGHEAHGAPADGLDVLVLGNLRREGYELLVEEPHENVVLGLGHGLSFLRRACTYVLYTAYGRERY